MRMLWDRDSRLVLLLCRSIGKFCSEFEIVFCDNQRSRFKICQWWFHDMWMPGGVLRSFMMISLLLWVVFAFWTQIASVHTLLRGLIRDSNDRRPP